MKRKNIFTLDDVYLPYGHILVIVESDSDLSRGNDDVIFCRIALISEEQDSDGIKAVARVGDYCMVSFRDCRRVIIDGTVYFNVPEYSVLLFIEKKG